MDMTFLLVSRTDKVCLDRPAFLTYVFDGLPFLKLQSKTGSIARHEYQQPANSVLCLVKAPSMGDRNASLSSAGARKRSVAEEPVTSVLKGGDIPVNDSGKQWNADEEVLAALGYKPEFRREFSLWTTFCVSFAVLGLLPSFATTLYYGMGYVDT